MTYELLCELFLLALLGAACARIFFMQAAKQDPLSIFPIVAFILSILNILAFGISIFRILIIILAFVVAVWNTNALSRFRHKLVVDHYGILFSLASIVNLILIIVLAVFIIILRPGKIDTKKYGVTITSQTYAGSVEEGFYEYTSPSQNRSVFVKKYTSTDETFNPFKESRTIIFVPGELSDVQSYEPFFVKLAHDGYTVYSADFYSKDIKWFGNLWDFKPFRKFAMLSCKQKKPEAYANATSQKSENFVKEVLALINIVSPSKSDRVFIAGDGESQASYSTIKIAGKDTVRGTFDLASISSYTTPGYGPVESTDPVLAKILGHPRDGSFYMSSHVAGLLEKYIDGVLNPAPAAKPTETTENQEPAVPEASNEGEKPSEEKQ